MILEYLRFFEEARKGEINALSYTDAAGWASLSDAFKKKGSTPTPVSAFLPFEEKRDKPKVLTDKTARIFAKLCKEKRLSPKLNYIAKSIPEVRKIL